MGWEGGGAMTPGRFSREREMITSPGRKIFRRHSVSRWPPVVHSQEGLQRILVAVKFTEEARELIRWTLTYGARAGDVVTVLHVSKPWEPTQASSAEEWEAAKEENVDSLCALVLSCRNECALPPKVSVTVEVVEDDSVGTAIISEAKRMNATMVVLGKCDSFVPLSPMRMTDLGRRCVKSLSAYCFVIIVRKGKMLICRPGTAKQDMRQSLRVLLEAEKNSWTDMSPLHAAMSQTEEFSYAPAGRRSYSSVCSSLYEKFTMVATEGSFDSSFRSTDGTRMHSRANSTTSEKTTVGRASVSSACTTSASCSPNSVLDHFAKLRLRKQRKEQRPASNGLLDLFLSDSCSMSCGYRSSSSSASLDGTVPPSPDESQTTPALSCSPSYPHFHHLRSDSSKGFPLLQAVSEEDGGSEEAQEAGAALATETPDVTRRLRPSVLARTCSELKYELSGAGLLCLQKDLEQQMPSIRRFSYDDLRRATSDFSAENLVGTGMASSVYKGQIEDGSWVAVKRLQDESFMGEKEFMMEIMMLICTHHHPNLVTLLGFCADGPRRLLVYEFLVRGNLEQNLHGESTSGSILNWGQRLKVALGAASGLAFLHRFEPRPIIHRDIKSQNILLRENFQAQVSDFGFAGWYSDGTADSSLPQGVVGTFGYMAPECFTSGHFDEKTDVFSFGVVLLELMSGRKPIDKRLPESQQSLVQWARWLQRKQEMHKLVDARLTDINPHQFKRMMYTAFLCIQFSPDSRPSMERVMKLLDPRCEYCEEPLLFTRSPTPEHRNLPIYTP
ncbi:hypothetical protein R1sor_019723 [Riccia sorocarpa]|uniref:Protein kinase domain-containing protein n=1 Tax=Riccia sorocarpa TaxID=122646 RepID=A0ABD3IEF4_9MARC